MGLEEARRVRDLVGRERAQSLFGLVPALEPPRRRDPHLAHLRVARGEPRERELAHRGSQRVPARSTALELDEEPASRESAKCLVRLFDPERGAELGGEALERGDPRDEVRDPMMLAGEDLGGEICEQRPAGAPHALECGGDFGGGHATQGLRGETDGRGPAPVSRCSSAATAGSVPPVRSESSVAVSSTSNASCDPVISRTCPCPRRRSTGKGSSSRDATTR